VSAIEGMADEVSRLAPLSMNVNLSARQLTDPNLVEHVKEALRETGVPPSSLKLELTETYMTTEIDAAEKVLGELQALGVGLKLDDFGTGYSSLSFLRTRRFDSIKIDRSFVSQLGADSEGPAIIGTILHLAKDLHMSVVAEGIENEAQLAELIRLGCDTGQGFYFSVPLTAEAAEGLLKSCESAGDSSPTILSIFPRESVRLPFALRGSVSRSSRQPFQMPVDQ